MKEPSLFAESKPIQSVNPKTGYGVHNQVTGKVGDAGVSPRPGLPCPKSEISNEAKLSGSDGKRYAVHAANVESFIKRCPGGEERLGFITFTFPEKLFDSKEAEKRMNSLLTGVLRKRYGRDHVAIFKEPHQDGSFHFHGLIHLPFVIRTERNLQAFRTKRYKSADKRLRDEWAYFRRVLPRYGFGRHRLEPVFGGPAAMTGYVCKYLLKGIVFKHAHENFKGTWMVRVPKAYKIMSSKFSWASQGASVWRAKLGEFAKAMRVFGVRIRDIDGFKDVFGTRWAYHLKGPLTQHTLGDQQTLYALCRTALTLVTDHYWKRVEDVARKSVRETFGWMEKVVFQQHYQALMHGGRI